jgi:UDP-N-acetylmuramate-alanine ligase
LVDELKQRNERLNVSYVPYEADFAQILNEIEPQLHEHDLLLLLGAGKVNKIADKLIL